MNFFLNHDFFHWSDILPVFHLDCMSNFGLSLCGKRITSITSKLFYTQINKTIALKSITKKISGHRKPSQEAEV